MNELIRESPLTNDRWISIHDTVISRIILGSHSVTFCFDEGYYLIENNQVFRSKRGYIELLGCCPSDLSCYYLERKPTRRGLKIKGKSISADRLCRMIENNRKIEIYLELYECNHFYWRGELLPNHSFQRKMAPVVIMESMDFYTMRYYWE